MAEEHSDVLAQFMTITGSEETTAVTLLEATNWQLQQAVELHFASGQTKPTAEAAGTPNGTGDSPTIPLEDEEEVRPPIPAKVERLVDGNAPLVLPYMRGRMNRAAHHEAFRNYSAEREELLHGADAPGATKGLAKLFKPPLEITFNGGFESAKQTAADDSKWVMVNIQSAKEFDSHKLNRDTFANDAVKQMISANFIFMQVYDVGETGQKLMTFYKVQKLPAILVIDPVTGALMQGMDGFIPAVRLVEDLVRYMECSPNDKGVGRMLNMVSQKARRREVDGGPSSSVQGEAGGTQEGRFTEDEQIAMAIAMSMETAEKPQDSGEEDPILDDEDSDIYPSSSEANGEHPSPGPSARDSADDAGPREESSLEGLDDGADENEHEMEADNQAVPLNECSADQPAGEAKAQLPLEPDPNDPDACTVGFRLPDGSRIHRKFRKSDPVQSLYNYGLTMDSDAAGGREFILVPMMPGATPVSKTGSTVEAAGVANSMLVLRWMD